VNLRKTMLRRRGRPKFGGQPEDTKDLGFGSRVAQESTTRFLNPDGSFNVMKTGLPFFRSLNLYHALLSISWPTFYLLAVSGYVLMNVLFAFGYMLCGPGALAGTSGVTFGERLLECFFFSVQTIGTIGYGHVSPLTLAANVLVTIESITGLLGLAVATGLVFARFARPYARIIFSKNAVVAPYHGISALEFRIANGRTNELIDVHATVLLSWMEQEQGTRKRRFHQLELERNQVMFFPLHWVVVHPIKESSPLYGITKQEFLDADAEILILLTGFDETFSQTVHSRSSYKGSEVVWGAKFGNIFDDSSNGKIKVDLRKIHDIVPGE